MFCPERPCRRKTGARHDDTTDDRDGVRTRLSGSDHDDHDQNDCPLSATLKV
jgi:hypothetical protein